MRDNRRVRPATSDDLKVSPLPHGAHRVYPTIPPPVKEVPAIEKPLSEETYRRDMAELRKHIRDIANFFSNNARTVDEYQVQSLTDSVTSVTWSAEWEVPITVTSVLITGPAGTFTLTLGKRAWNLTMPAAGFLFIGAPLSFLLGRNDVRQLTSGTAGDWAVEVMGYANIDWKLH